MPDWRDVVLLALFALVVIVIVCGLYQMITPFDPAHQVPLSLSPRSLPIYALRTAMRMLLAMLASLLFTLTYATLAAKNKHAERIMIPLLDILQSVPILGYLSATIVFFISLSPHTVLGAELAAIFAIFTSQAWNMAFSFYQSLRTVPHDLDEVCGGYMLTGWQRFWKLEVPFAMPGLLWNAMMSMSGGWFFVVASEAIAVGELQINLPGVGSYMATAIQGSNLRAVGWAILAMLATILAYDQLLFRPLVAWSDKFRYEQTSGQIAPRSWLLNLCHHAPLMRRTSELPGKCMNAIAGVRVGMPRPTYRIPLLKPPPWMIALLWYFSAFVGLAEVSWQIYAFAAPMLTMHDVSIALSNGLLTLLRVVTLIVLTTFIWVPIGVAVGLRPRLAEKVQPIIQFLAAFPANLLYPVFVVMIVHFDLSPRWWLSPLMIFGTQWYILFNVIAGATAFPSDFREAAAVFHIRHWRWWRNVILPGIFPYYVTGAITASGGAWNASIVSELVSWGQTKLNGGGLGAYIAQMTQAGDFPRITLGIVIMSVMVIAMNRLLWRPLYAFAERRTRLD